MLLQHGVDGLEPLHRVLGGSHVDHAILAAIQGGVVLFRRRDGISKAILEEGLRGAAVGKGHAGVHVKVLHPGRTLMGEGHGIVAMEVVQHLLVRGGGQILHRGGSIVPVAAHQNDHLRRNGADAAHRLLPHPVPHVDEALLGDLVQQLEHDQVGHAAIAAGNILPQGVEALLIGFVVEEAGLGLALVKGEARRFVQIQHHLQAILAAHLRRPVQLSIAAAVVQHIVVHGDAHVIQLPAGDLRKVLFLDELVEPRVAVVALAQPAAQVHTAVDAHFLQHD